MSSIPAPDRAHPVLRSALTLGEVLDGAHQLPLWSMSAEESSETLRAVYAAEAQLAALRLKLVAHGEQVGVPAHDAAVSMKAWLRDQVLVEPCEAKRQVELARQLAAHDPTASVLATGDIPAASAAVIVKAVDALPDHLETGLAERAESHLLGEAKTHDTGLLRDIAAGLEQLLNPDRADERLAKQLAQAEAKAARQTYFTIRHNELTATSYGTFQVPLHQGVKLQRQLEAIANPRRPDPVPFEHEDGSQISADERRGVAFGELIDRIPLKALPKTGGCDPTVVVTMTLETLLGGIRPAVLDTGHRISPGLARRLASQCGVIPAVLGTRSEVLDLGRKARLATKKQRLAMSVQQHGTCAQDNCDRPAAWADAHHLNPWRAGGHTDLHDMVLLCRRHHTMADHPDHKVTRLGPGRIRINRRT